MIKPIFRIKQNPMTAEEMDVTEWVRSNPKEALVYIEHMKSQRAESSKPLATPIGMPTFTPVGLVAIPSSFATLEEAIREAIIVDLIYGQVPNTVTVKQTSTHEVNLWPHELAELQAIAAERKQAQMQMRAQWVEEMMKLDSSELAPPPIINGLLFKMTCCASPEQYDIFKDGKQVAYSRLRHGCLEVRVPDHAGEVIYYSEKTFGDGCFTDGERAAWLKIIADKIIEHATPIISQIYECVDKGGSYECLGLAKPAGDAKDEIGDVYTYRCTETGQLYFRLPSDFSERMRLKDGEL